MAAIGSEMLHDLGDWICRRLEKGVLKQGTVAQSVLDAMEDNVLELRGLWADQRQTQLSIQARK